MSRVITDQAAFLMEAKESVKELEELKDFNDKIGIEEKRLEKAIASEKKAVEDAIAVTVKRRKEEISASYDKEIGKDQDKLKKIKSKREKAKNQGIKERIDEETAQLRDENKELKAELKTLFRTNHVPPYCNSMLYYSLYFTKGLKELLVFLLTITICFLVIPCGIFFLLPHQEPIILVGIYFVTIVVFGGLYVMINNITKGGHLEVLRQGRAARNLIIMNNRKIKAIIKKVKSDQNEEVYNLENFDDEIAQLEVQIASIGKRKQEALINFDNVTKNIIADEIMGNSQDRIDQLEEKFNEIAEKHRDTENLIKARSIYITDNYEVFVGREFLQEERLDKLIGIISGGEAENVTEAIQVYKNGKS